MTDDFDEALPFVTCVMIHLSLLCIVYFHVYKLPPAMPATIGADTFSAGRTRLHLNAFGAMGVRTLGSRANEIEAPLYLLKTLDQIQTVARQPLEFELQHASGVFRTQFLDGLRHVD